MNLLEKIHQRTARVAVIGLGYVGLPLAVELARAGLPTLGIDVDVRKVETINAGQSHIQDVPAAEVAAQVSAGRLKATTGFAELRECDVAVICVPTPLSKTHDPDLSYVLSATEAVAEYVHPGMLIVLESTTYPGTTEEVLLPRVLRYGLTLGVDVFVAFSPERIDPGRKDFTLRNTPKVVGGCTPACLEAASALYATFTERVVPVSSAGAAEMVKLLENTFRAVNIALVNEVMVMCDKLGLDAWEIVEAAATKPYGFMKFTPGPGVGGHCIPLDPEYLAWKMRTLDYHSRFIHLASEVNRDMPAYWVNKVAEALNSARKAVNGSRVLVLGVTYKPDIDDVRESPALDIIELLAERGAAVAFHDPYVTDLHHEGLSTPYTPLTDDVLTEADCVMVVTHHSTYDWAHIQRLARLVVDTRHVMARR